MDKSFKISMPLFMTLGKSSKCKKYYINLNAYRNWHFQVSNNIKKEYKREALLMIPKVELEKISLEFVLYKKDKRRQDRANALSIHEKFFCDALVEGSFIGDDSDNYIESTTYRTGGIDKENPRVDIYVTDLIK